MGEEDIQANAHTSCRGSAFVGRLHDSGPATRDHGESAVHELLPQLLGQGVLRILRTTARGAEDGHRGGHSGHRLESVDELGHDPKHPPGLIACTSINVGSHRHDSSPFTSMLHIMCVRSFEAAACRTAKSNRSLDQVVCIRARSVFPAIPVGGNLP